MKLPLKKSPITGAAFYPLAPCDAGNVSPAADAWSPDAEAPCFQGEFCRHGSHFIQHIIASLPGATAWEIEEIERSLMTHVLLADLV
jgi:hypothetical protein